VARVEGVTDRSGAEKTHRIEVFAPRANLPPPDEDEFIWPISKGPRGDDRRRIAGQVLTIRISALATFWRSVRAGRRDPAFSHLRKPSCNGGPCRRPRGDRAPVEIEEPGAPSA